ncbi:MAG: hypothetical protein AB1430_22720 [Pseudomonadota bacterium]
MKQYADAGCARKLQRGLVPCLDESRGSKSTGVRLSGKQRATVRDLRCDAVQDLLSDGPDTELAELLLDALVAAGRPSRQPPGTKKHR